MGVVGMITVKTVVDTIYYLLKKIGKCDKLKIIKLIYLADKYHLAKYGRTITNDDYYAMEYGPVATTAKDVLSFDKQLISSKEREYAEQLIKHSGKFDFEANKNVNVDIDTLSETDKEVLNFVINKFGKMKSDELVKYTHKYPEWAQYEDLFQNGLIRRERIAIEELLSLVESDSDLGIPQEHIEETKKVLTGAFL